MCWPYACSAPDVFKHATGAAHATPSFPRIHHLAGPASRLGPSCLNHRPNHCPPRRTRPLSPLTPLKFTLDFRINGQTAPFFFLALNKGCYKDEGMDVSIDVGAGSVTSITRIASRVYQMCLGDVSSLVEFNAKNPGTSAVQALYHYYNRAPFVIIGRKDRGITTDFRSLEGKKIAAAAVEFIRLAWPRVALKLRVKSDLFSWTTTDFRSRDNVAVLGDVDGVTYFHDSAVSLFARLKADDLAALSYANAGVNPDHNAILASSNLIAQNPKVAVAFLRVTNRSLVDTFANPAPAIAAIKQH